MRGVALAAVLVLAGCTPAVSPLPSPSALASPIASAACVPTDQDQYVYHPSRLTVVASCIHATGTVAAVRSEQDGDFHILVKPDPQYANLVNAANQGIELGDLVVEPVCELAVSQTDAQAACAADQTKLDVSAIAVGQHVWVDGRYVLDTDHSGWAEIHPLYRWGMEPGLGVALPSESPPAIENEAP